jgi:O-antigen/teichoic acid export membrane protein
MIRRMRNWSQDSLLRGVIKNSSYLFSSNAVSILLSMLQGIFAARLLGALEYGIVAAVVIPFTSGVHRLLSFRMSELVVKYLGQFLAAGQKDRAAAVVKGAALVEMLTSGLAYGVVLLAMPLAARYLAKDPQTTLLFRVYGLILLAYGAYETATGILQVTHQFKRIAQIQLLQNMITVSLIFLAFVTKGGMLQVTLGYLIGKAAGAVILYLAAARSLRLELGKAWWKVTLRWLPNPKEVGRFALSTNLQGTVNLVVRDSESLFITALRSPAEAGYFKIAMGVINLVMLPIEPFISTTYAEITRTIARNERRLTQSLLKRITGIAGAWTLVAGSFLAISGFWLIPFLYGADFSPSYPAVLILLLGYGCANVVNWNRPLLLALGMPGYPLKVSAWVGLVKTALTLVFLPVWGYLAEAALVSIYLVTTVGMNVWRGLHELRPKESSTLPAVQ